MNAPIPASSVALLLALVVGGALLVLWLLMVRVPRGEPVPDSARLLLFAALAVMALGVVVYVCLPALLPGEVEAVRELRGTHRAVLLDLLAVVLLAAPLTAIGVSALVWLLGERPVETVGGQVRLRPEGILLGVTLTDIPMLFVLWGRVVRAGVATPAGLGLRWRGWSDVRLGLLSGVGVLVLMGAVGLVLRHFGLVSEQMQQFAIQGASPSGFLLALMGGAVFAPIVEELFFRGYIFRAYAERKGLWRAYLYSAALFGLVHLNLPGRAAGDPLGAAGSALAVFVPITLTGLVLARLYQATGSLVPGIIAHAVNNATAFAAVFFGLART